MNKGIVDFRKEQNQWPDAIVVLVLTSYKPSYAYKLNKNLLFSQGSGQKA